MATVWIILAATGAVLVLFGIARLVRSFQPSAAMRGLPTTALERLARVGIIVTLAVGVGLGALLAIWGVSGFQENELARGIFFLLLVAALGAWTAAWRIMSRPSGTTVVDERDRDVLARSFSVESVVVILSLVAWTVVLTEVFWDEGAIPLGYLQLVFWTTFLGGAFGRSLGIVLGYRREPMVDA